MRWLKSTRAVNNIIATMLIFSMMIVSMGVLYSTISPTVLGFQAETINTNQEFILLSIQNEMENLISSASGAQTRISITSNDATYRVSEGKALDISISDAGGIVQTQNVYTGEFSIDVEGSFQYEVNEKILTRTISEDSMIQNDTTVNNSNFVAKVQYDYSIAYFTLYTLTRVDVVQTGATSMAVIITTPQIYFLTHNGLITGTSLDFPIQDSDWTLRLRRITSTTVSTSNLVNGPFSIDHDIDGVTSPTSYAFGDNTITNLEITFVTVPILFTI
ncbi:MAG: hypothetical protein INQ03_19155 [Candidatus Heimdallarchaeota archaeon]|nr:hypothetical protein [Candidatus Heimdallarchaeota archaeon]